MQPAHSAWKSLACITWELENRGICTNSLEHASPATQMLFERPNLTESIIVYATSRSASFSITWFHLARLSCRSLAVRAMMLFACDEERMRIGTAALNRNKSWFGATVLITVSPIMMRALSNTRLRLQIVRMLTRDYQILFVMPSALQFCHSLQRLKHFVIAVMRLQFVRLQVNAQHFVNLSQKLIGFFLHLV